MGTAANLEQAIKGLMAVERRIIELATERKIGGLRFEWNDDLDFGHMQDPVPVSIFEPHGKVVEAEFSQVDLVQFPSGHHAAIDASINRIVQELREEG